MNTFESSYGEYFILIDFNFEILHVRFQISRYYTATKKFFFSVSNLHFEQLRKVLAYRVAFQTYNYNFCNNSLALYFSLNYHSIQVLGIPRSNHFFTILFKICVNSKNEVINNEFVFTSYESILLFPDSQQLNCYLDTIKIHMN